MNISKNYVVKVFLGSNTHYEQMKFSTPQEAEVNFEKVKTAIKEGKCAAIVLEDGTEIVIPSDKITVVKRFKMTAPHHKK